MFAVTAEQYAGAVAFRDACHEVADLLRRLERTHVKSAGSMLTVFDRQAKQIDDLPPPPQTEMAGQKLKQLRKLRGNALKACALLDAYKARGIAGTEEDTWSHLRAMDTALDGIPDENGRPYVAGQKHGL